MSLNFFIKEVFFFSRPASVHTQRLLGDSSLLITAARTHSTHFQVDELSFLHVITQITLDNTHLLLIPRRSFLSESLSMCGLSQ